MWLKETDEGKWGSNIYTKYILLYYVLQCYKYIANRMWEVFERMSERHLLLEFVFHLCDRPNPQRRRACVVVPHT